MSHTSAVEPSRAFGVSEALLLKNFPSLPRHCARQGIAKTAWSCLFLLSAASLWSLQPPSVFTRRKVYMFCFFPVRCSFVFPLMVVHTMSTDDPNIPLLFKAEHRIRILWVSDVFENSGLIASQKEGTKNTAKHNTSAKNMFGVWVSERGLQSSPSGT